MFWRYGFTTSNLTALLDRGDATLQEVLKEEDVLQECKANNERLIDLLIRSENLIQLVDYVTELPSEDLSERDRFKYSSISCELLIADIPIITEALINSPECMARLDSFLADNQTLNPILGSYVAKIISSLILKRPENFLNYMRQKENFMSNLIKHIDTPAIINVLLTLIALLENKDLRAPLIDWLKEIRLIKKLADLFSPDVSSDVHSNASQFICEMIKISREQIQNIREGLLNPAMSGRYSAPLIGVFDEQSQQSQASSSSNLNPSEASISFLYKNSLLDELESEETIESLFQSMFELHSKANCGVTYILDVFFVILEPATYKSIMGSSDPLASNQSEKEKLQKEKERLEIAFHGIKTVTTCCLKHFPTIQDMLLKSKPKNESFKITNGVDIPTLGIVRLGLIKLVAKLVSLNDQSINDQVIKSEIISLLFDMIFVYKWNNFLHTFVSNVIINAINSDFKLIDIEFENQMSVDESENERSNDSQPTTVTEQSQKEKVTQFLEENTFMKHIVKDSSLIKRLVDVWQSYFSETRPESTQENPKPKRKIVNGYMGHILAITNHIYSNSIDGKYSPYLTECLNNWLEKELLDQWTELNKTQIDDINKVNSKDLVRNPLNVNSDSSKFDADLDLPPDAFINKKLFDFNSKEMKTYFEESKFSLKQNFLGSKSKSNDSAQMFEQVCMGKDSQYYNNNDEDIWVTQDIKFAESSEEKKEEWISVTDDNMFRTSDDLFKTTSGATTSSSLFIEQLVSKSEKSLATQTKSLTSKKYSEDLSRTNYTSSSSSSSSSNDERESDDDDNDLFGGSSKKSKSKKKHNRDDKIREDLTTATTSGGSGKQEEWADFDAFISAESAKDTTGSKNLENMLNSDEDPWNEKTSSSTTPDVATPFDASSATTPAQQPGQKEDWANFDNFN